MGASGSTQSSSTSSSVGSKGAGSGKTARRGNPSGGKQSTSSPALKKGPRNYVEIEGVEEDGSEQLEGGKGLASQLDIV